MFSSENDCGIEKNKKEFFEAPRSKWETCIKNNTAPFFKITNSKEFDDFLLQFPILRFKKDDLLFYDGYFLHTKDYKEKNLLKIILKKPISVLFIPDIHRKKLEENNSKYFSNETLSQYRLSKMKGEENYLTNKAIYGDEIIEGVKNWNSKGYSKIEHFTFPERITLLGFNGFATYEGCVVYISPNLFDEYLKIINF